MLDNLLLQEKAVDPGILQACLEEQRQRGIPLGRLLLKRSAITEEALLDILSTHLNIPRESINPAGIDPSVLKEVPARVASHYHCMPIGWEKNALKIAVTYAVSPQTLDEMRVVLRKDICAVLAAEQDVDKAMKSHYGIGADTLERLVDDEEDTATTLGENRSDHDIDASQEASVAKFVNQMFLEAYQSRATDIHIEPYGDDLRVRYRIDGVLYEAKISESLKRFQASITSRIKIMADLSISEKRLPQDGRIMVRVEGQEMDLRVSTLPTPFGESIGIRLLTSRQFLDLPYLGFAEKDLKELGSYLTKPHGILFLTGPTGSGKTTTLYAFLKQINKTDKKIITLEDPIEYQMKGITQVQVHPKVGLTFGHGLRSMLRHDPDVMMVGEVRDFETAEIAIRVALTGHLVFSTLHTNDASGAVTRLEDIGVEPYLISSSVLCIIAQRLVRVICSGCKTSQSLSDDLLKEFGFSSKKNPPSSPFDKGGESPPFEKGRSGGISVYYGKGCEACKQTGFRGRTVIYEILPITTSIQELITSRAPANVIREKALSEGMKPLRMCGWEKILQGITTPDEVIRATLQEGF